jgi:transglutaminase-like putative cysteine protease
MNFAGWFEAYLGGAWHTFDPRNNQRRIGRILLARGRDAADVAISTTFGRNTLELFRVWADEVKEAQPLRRAPNRYVPALHGQVGHG